MNVLPLLASFWHRMLILPTFAFSLSFAAISPATAENSKTISHTPSTLAEERAAISIPFPELGAKAMADCNGKGTGIEATADGGSLHTDFQKLSGSVTREGLWLESKDIGGGCIRVIAAAIGRDSSGTATLPATGSVAVGDKSVLFSRPGLTEEYSVSVDGVRQDFIIAERPAGEGNLQVDIAVTGARAEAAVEGVKLTIASSGRVLIYNRLRVFDATGLELKGTIEVLATDRIAVRVDDTTAAYPVRIDPTFSDADWVSLNPGIPGANGTVYAIAVDSSGNVYIGGYFTVVGSVPANCIAKWNGSAWSALGTGISGGGIKSLTVSGTDVYVGGYFTTAGGVPASNIAKWNGSTWSALGSGLSGNALALTTIGAVLYAGGDFTTAGEVAANHIAKWNGSAWSTLGSGITGVSYTAVYALAASGSDLYAGGNFTAAGGTAANHIAKWNGSVWSALGSGMNSQVKALAVVSSNLYAGGSFSTAGGVTANNIAKWNGSAWSSLGSGVDSGVSALAVIGSDIYVGGWFFTAGGVSASRIARWDGSVWSAIGSGMGGGPVNALAASGTELYAGGDFTPTSDLQAKYIAKWNGAAWSALGSGMDSTVRALALIGSDLYVGGDFTTVGGVAANHIAKWNGTAWSTLGSGLNGNARALAVIGTDLYVGGEFTTAGGVAANHIAKWNGSTWLALGSGTTGVIGGQVNALTVNSGNLYAGGGFDTAGGVAANNIAKWNGTAWSALGSGIDNSGMVWALAGSGNDIYAGGGFNVAGGVTVNGIAKWNGNAWSALGTGMNNFVMALVVNGTDIYAGGPFDTASGVSANCVAKWNGNTWSALGGGIGNPGGVGNPTVNALALCGADLFVGGNFTTAGGVSASRIAKWNGSTWSALGSGMSGAPGSGINSGPVYALAASGSDYLFLGGDFSIAGSTVSPFIAKANLIPLPTITVLDGAATLTDGNATPLNFGYTPVGVAVSRTFTITNKGGSDLTLGAILKDGTNAADFIAGTPASSTVTPSNSTSFTVTFTPIAAGVETAVIHIASNVIGATNPFDIAFSGTGLSFTADTDGDGMSDAAEFNLSALGFDWQVNQRALVTTYYAGANSAGLYTTQQIQAMNTATPLISRNPATGKFKLIIDWKKSTDLTNFSDFPAPAGSSVSINTDGNIEFEFSVQDNAAFFRLEAN